MKKLTCLFILVFCLSLQMMAQVKKTTAKPATPAMPDIEKMLKDLPPDQRAMVKEMMGNKISAVANKVEPVKKAASPIIKIPLKQPLQVPTQAQAKDRLLWYKGKKINDSMLVTTKAMLVLYSDKRNMVVAEPLEKTDSFRLMVKNLSKEAKMTEDYIEGEAAKKNGFLNYPLIQMTVDRFEVLDEQFNNALKNTIDLPEVPVGNSVPQSTSTSPKSHNVDLEKGIAGMYEKLKTLLANEPDKNFDAPPKEQLGVSYRCDKNALKLYAEAEKTWQDKFNQYEYDLVRSAMAIERSLQLSSYEESDIDATFPGLSADLQRAHELHYTRLDEKESKLISTYGKNIFMKHCVVTTILAYERQKQLSGRDEKDGEFSTVLTDLMNNPEIEIYINEQIEKKNWDVILDLPYMMGLQRQAQLMSADMASERLQKLTQKLLNLNRFVLTVDIDFNVRYHDDGEDVLKVNGSIKTTDKVYVSLFPGTCPRWILALPSFDYEMKKLPYIPLQVVSGLKSIKDDKNWINYSYSGPKDMIMFSPVFAIDFTRTNEPDTAVLQTLRYVDDVPSMPVANAYTTDLPGYLNDVYLIPEETGANEQMVMELGKNMMAKFSEIATIQNNSTTLEKLKSQHSMMLLKQGATKGAAEIINTTKPMFLFNAQNGTSIIVDAKLDTKHKNDDVEVVYGIFKLKVVNEPITD